jgi:uncharacterized protein
MPEYVAPGVYVGETSYRAKSIQGVDTSTTAFVGPARNGSLGVKSGAPKVPELLTSFSDFERIYGGIDDLDFTPQTNYLAHAVRAFFNEGGSRLHVSRVISSNGAVPVAADYALALGELEGLEDIAIVAAPGASAYGDAQAINNLLISYAEARRAIAVLDLPPDQSPTQARALRGLIDSHYAAMYYPWVVIANPLVRPGREDIPRELALPPSGFLCGIYARNDAEHGVWKAPANEVVRGALRLEFDVTRAQQEMLNPIGVNCLRHLPGRGHRVWGARLASSDPEWRYIHARRYLNYLESSIDRGTQWAVFEPNGERLWANVRRAVSDFLYQEWRKGALRGTKAEDAYFVRCDRSTMTQSDLDRGHLVSLIGVAVSKPAEFLIFRIGQDTADVRA